MLKSIFYKLLSLILLFQFSSIFSFGSSDDNILKPNKQLLIASKEGNFDLIKKAIHNGANVNITDENGNTPLMLLKGSNDLEVFKFLLDHGADVNARNRKRYTPLILAASDPSMTVDIINLLISRDADVNAKAKMNMTALMSAALAGNTAEDARIVKALLLAGADANEKNTLNKNALDLAISKDHDQIVATLIEIPKQIQKTISDELNKIGIPSVLNEIITGYLIQPSQESESKEESE